MTTSPIGNLPLLPTNPVNPDVIHNEAIVRIEALLRGVLDKDLTSPPAHGDGQAYIVGPAATGAWTGQSNRIALSYGGTWLFWPAVDAIGAAQEGERVWVADEDLNYRWTGSAWTAVATIPDGSVGAPGIVFAAAPTYGLYRSGGTVGISLGGIAGMTVGATGMTTSRTGGTNNEWLMEAETGGANLRASRYNASGATGSATLILERAGGTIASPADITTGHTAGRIFMRGYSSSAMRNVIEERVDVIAGTPSSSDMQSRLSVLLNPASSATLTAIYQLDWSTGLTLSTILALQRQAVTLTSDNQVVTPTRSTIELTSDNATATNRTFTLANGADGQEVEIIWQHATNRGELAATSNCKLGGGTTWSPDQYDTIRLKWSAGLTAWVELSRSANA